MKWRTASLLLVLTSCGSPSTGILVDHQEGPAPSAQEETTEVEATEVEATEAPVALTDPVVGPEDSEGEDEVPVPQSEVADQERVILHQQVQEMEDDLLGLYVEVLKGKCLQSGGSEKDCDSEARQKVEERYNAAEEAAAESAR